jgi:ABC-type sugar transport system permease subunit
MRFTREWPTIVRPLASIVGTLILGAIAIGFLAIWTNPEIQTAGLWERVVTTSQAVYPALVIFLSWRFMKNHNPNVNVVNKV